MRYINPRFTYLIYTTINFTVEFKNVSVIGWLDVVGVGMVDTRLV